MFGRFNGFIFSLFLFISSLFGTIFILFPFIPLAYFSPRSWRMCADRFVGYWLIFPASMIFFLFGVDFYITGDIINHTKPAIIIMNHRTRLDWLFFWNALYKIDPWLLTTKKILLKSSLKRIPGAGWAMCCGAYIFINRCFKLDKQILKHLLKYYKDSSNSYQLLLFPEGTDFSPFTIESSNNFADKKGLPHYSYLLHPRTTGLNYILNNMVQNDYIDSIYDVTIGYPDRIVKSEMELFYYGHFPKSVHFNIKKYSIEDVIKESTVTNVNENNDYTQEFTKTIDCSKWLQNIWRQKEERLRLFYSEKNNNLRMFNTNKYKWPVKPQGVAYYIAFGFWIFFSIFWTYILAISWLVRCYFIISILFYLWANKRSGGVEFLSLELFYGCNLFLNEK